MSQQQIYEYLRDHKGQAFDLKQLAEITNVNYTNVAQNVRRMRMYKEIERRIDDGKIKLRYNNAED